MHEKNFSGHCKSTIKSLLKNSVRSLVTRLQVEPSLAMTWTETEEHVFEHVKVLMGTLENDAHIKDRKEAVTNLRQLSLDDFGLVFLTMPDPQYPKLSRLLPAMASEKVQVDWTGKHGVPLLKETTAFMRALRYNYMHVTGRSINDATILDYGCGYGRLAQLLLYFTAEEKIFGVDPWDRSIELCHEAGLSENFAVSEYLPTCLPVGETQFDLIYAFSVFTHLSRRAMTTSLATLRRYLKHEGLLAITIRPVEYWDHDPHTSPEQKDILSARHRMEGFVFNPHNRAPIDGDVTYGDSSMTLQWLADTFPEWIIKATDRCLIDPLQQYVFMMPR